MKAFVRVVAAVVLVLGFLLSDFGSSLAQDAVAIQVSPVSFNLPTNPGETLTNQVRVTNLSEGNILLSAKVESITSVSELGRVNIGEQENEFSLTSWVTVEPKAFALAGKQSRLVSFVIKVPANAEPGGHYGSISISTVASDDPNLTGSAVAQKLGSLLLLRVSGEATERAIISDFQTKSFVGGWDEVPTSESGSVVLVAKDEDFTAEKNQSYFSRGPVAFDLTFKNLGNVHIKPAGFVTIKNIFGRKVAEIPIDSRNVFPGVERKITVIYPDLKLWGLKYSAQFLGIYGSANQQVSAETAFWAFPLIPGVIIIVGLTFILIARKRLIKAISIIFRGR